MGKDPKTDNKDRRAIFWALLQGREPGQPATYLDLVRSFASFLGPFWALIFIFVGFTLFMLMAQGLPDDASDLRYHALAIAGLVAIIGGLISAPFALIKVWVNERQARTAEQGQITDRITKAVEQLGAEKTVYVNGDAETRPNLEVRLGAIYALERIAQDSERDHIPIMETLCAYVRENSPASMAKNLNLAEWEPLPDDASEEMKARREEDRKARFGRRSSDSNARQWALALPAPRVDVQAALTVIGRRTELRLAYEKQREFRLDLRAANLQRADLTAARLGPVLLQGARMEGADLSGARMEGANLSRARMEGANLSRARMEGADLFEARMEGADLRLARMEGADLRLARMEGADLFEARMEGANLRLARLKSVDLAFCTFARTNARSTDFTEAKHMTQEQVNALYGDHKTKLPEGLARTDLMDREPLESLWASDPDYDAWLAAGAPPGTPITK